MPATYKVLGQSAPAATTATDLYTVGAGKSAVISTAVIANRANTAATFRLSVRPAGAAGTTIAMGGYFNQQTFISVIQFPTMRTTPTATIVNGTSYWSIYTNNGIDFADNAGINTATPNSVNLEITGSVSGIQGYIGQLRTESSLASIILSSEL